jgi:ATP-binding cassette subfamily F protein 3
MLIDALDAYHGTLCFITHDRTVIREIANKIIEIKNGVAIVFDGNYDEYLAWKEKQNIPDQPVLKAPIKAVTRDTAPRDLQRRRKIAEGELRNNFYKENEPLKKRIGKVEANLAKLEAEFRDLETYLATPESYGDRTELTAKTRRHEELITVIKRATEEWEKLSLEIEVKKQAFEQAQRELETEYGLLFD